MANSIYYKVLRSMRPGCAGSVCLTSGCLAFGRAICLIVALTALALVGAAAVHAEELRPPFHIGGLPVGASAAEAQMDASVASDGEGFLVVWGDGRALSSTDIYGVRVRADGSLIEDAGILVSGAAGIQESPAAAHGESEYFIVWKDDRNGGSDIYGSRVAADGSVIDPSGIAVSTYYGGQGYPAVAYGDSLYFVAWTDARDEVTTHIYGTRVTLDGGVLDPDGIAISSPAGTGESQPAVAYDGTNFLVVWEDTRNGGGDIYGARVTAGGQVLDTLGIQICAASGDQALPAVSSGAASSMVVWEDARNGALSDIYGSRIGPDGTVLDPAGVQICGSSADQINSAVTFDGSVWLAVWNDLRAGGVWNVYAARIDSAGAVLDPDGFAVCTFKSQQFNPSVAFADSIYLVAWHDSRNGPKDIYGARIRQETTVLENWLLISRAPAQQANAAVSYDGSHYLAVWDELRLGTGRDIRGLRFEPDETLLDESSIEISAASGDQILPAAAAGGDGWLVAWQDARGAANDIYGARVSSEGALLDGAGIGISLATGAQECPAVAYDGSNYLVVWQDARAGSYDIYAARVSAAGAVLEADGIAVSTASGDQTHPAVAFDGANFLVLWQDYRSGTSYDIYGARVSPSGAVLDLSGIAISTATGAQEYPAAAFDGTAYLVAWQDKRGGPYGDIYASRVQPDGTVLDATGISISTATLDQLYPSIAFQGTYYYIAWQDSRRTTRPDIFGARVQSNGTVLDPTGMQINVQSFNQLAPSVAAGIAGQVMIAYSSFTHAPVFGSARIWANSYGPVAGVDEPAVLPGVTEIDRGPNPFVGTIRLAFTLSERQPVSVTIYDVKGRVVADLFAGVADQGRHEIEWNGMDSRGTRAAPGLYFLSIRTRAGASSRKIVLVE